MKLYNTQSRRKEPLSPTSAPKVTLYTCGPTVYLEPTIGNWRAFIFYDLLHRALMVSKYKVDRVMNITDVGHLVGDGDTGEDKVQAAAKKQRKTAWDIAEQYTKIFMAESKLLHLAKPTKLLRATEHIKDQILLLEILEKKGFTYRTSDGIYFDTSKLKDYGKLAGDISGRKAGARVAVNKEKRNHQDFALWKFSPKNAKRDMEWDSPWGKGYPGWHLECSAMALEYLGKTIDIHAGGVDHIGTHHTNEIAQSEAATGQTFAKLWIHNEFLLAEGKKMSKSLGNFYTLSDVIKKGYHPLAFKILVLQAHYQTQMNFTFKALAGAQTNLETLYAMADRQFQLESPLEEASDKSFAGLLKQTKEHITESLQNNLDSPGALAKLQVVADYVFTHSLNGLDATGFMSFLKFVDRALGLDLHNRQDITPEQKELIVKRDVARHQGEFKEADAIRDDLLAQGLNLDDTPHGTRWSRQIGTKPSK